MVQSFNLDAVVYYPYVRLVKRELAIPHFMVATVGDINPDRVKEYGFKGIIFDKDNTLTPPYINTIYPPLQTTVMRFKELFDDRVVIMSNHAGTRDDPGHKAAEKIEHDLHIPVLRHTRKKPGGIDAVMAYFNCRPDELIMCGDRVFTDVVFGNRYGMLTILTTLLTEKGDNPAARRARRYEIPLMKKWMGNGIRPPPHPRYHKDICRDIREKEGF